MAGRLSGDDDAATLLGTARGQSERIGTARQSIRIKFDRTVAGREFILKRRHDLAPEHVKEFHPDLQSIFEPNGQADSGAGGIRVDVDDACV